MLESMKKSCDCKWHSSICDCARPGTNQVCLLDYGCPCADFTLEVPTIGVYSGFDGKEVKRYRKRIAMMHEKLKSSTDLTNKIIEKAWNDTLEYLKSDEFAARINYLCVINHIRRINNIQIESDMKNEQVVHVCLGDDRHYYFGSVAAIFDRFTPDELGVSLTTLWNYGLAPDRPYKNNRCAIYRGNIDRKKQTK